MIPIFREFINDLEIPETTLVSLGIPRNNQELKIFAYSLPNLEFPDTYVLAGRIYIYLHILSSPRSVRDYVEILDRVLRKEIKDFIIENEKVLDELLEETYFENYRNYNILSASSCVNYLLKISQHDPPVETPCQMALRQAIQFYYEEGVEKVVKCYREIIDQEYIHASPTMFNAGTRKNQMSSCFLLNLGDNLESLLYTGAGDVGLISKLQGGIGLSMNSIRHSSISNSGKSSGVLPFAKIYDSTIMCVDQGGKRNGAMTISLNDWHIDFPEFIVSRDNYTHNGIRLKQANICGFISSLFMKRVREGKKWTLFCPAKAELDGEKLVGKSGHEFEDLYHRLEKEVERRKKDLDSITTKIEELEKIINSGKSDEVTVKNFHLLNKERLKIRKNVIDYKVVDAKTLFNTFCDMNNKSAMPYLVYRDTVNYKNNMKNIGPCEGLNLCLEICEPSTPDEIASCNLGHLNLKRFVKTDSKNNLFYDFNHLGRATRSVVENINKVINYNYYPLDERDSRGNVVKQGKISKPNFDNRPIGVGVSGLAEVFAKLKIAYDSDDARALNKKIFACMYFNAMYMSMMLAKKDGEYKNFRTGKSRLFVDGKFTDFDGSPLSNGFFQFDLWKQEAEYLESKGDLNTKIYDKSQNEPVDPRAWDCDLEISTWEDLRKSVVEYGVKNALLIALMPTASSAQMLGNAETTEAHQTLIYSRKLVHGNYTTFSEPFVDDMIEAGLWNKKMIDFILMCNGSIEKIHHFVSENPQYFSRTFYSDDNKIKKEKLLEILDLKKIHKGMYEISQKVTTAMARERGVYVCQSQSLNIYLGEPNISKIKSVHMYTDALRLKTGMYYLRQNPASQTGRFTVDREVQNYHQKMKNKKYICTETECLMCQ